VSNVTLGYNPHTLKVLLIRDSDFHTTLIKAPTEDDPTPEWAPATITLRIGTDDFPFTTSGDTAELVIDKALVNELIDARTRTARLYYKEGTADEVWALGEVESRG
jgi:hypothetical protein